jgi:hypothetical protein
MRDWFVGILFVVGLFLLLYRGFSDLEDYVLDAAGVLAVGVAIFPMVATSERVTFSMHGFCAIAFFFCIAFVCLFCARDTLPLVRDQKRRSYLRKLYSLVGISMIASMIAAYLLNTVIKSTHRIFWVEACGVLSFGAYWWVKSWELGNTAAEPKAIQGRLLRVGREIREPTA